jgi:hypothetical protein
VHFMEDGESSQFIEDPLCAKHWYGHFGRGSTWIESRKVHSYKEETRAGKITWG